ncbi:N-acetyltransferase [Epithele typhae]|uniref:N-acetyltransferase n=1 Tax=Epithele typhae TaxID=378194 RepID=UPI002007813C|nr:N-acetyltransferase [Epithele typhae]KAH9921181.1 N-acetyltransferase [Epithele typhae]
MTTIRAFKATDLFKFNHILVTPQYAITFYLTYLSRWPDMCAVSATPQGRLMGYMIGKAEGQNLERHGHVTALTVAPEYRRLGISRRLVAFLEHVSDEVYRGLFVDLYVRCVNLAAIGIVYRRPRLGMAPRDEEDGFDMRKPLTRDPMRRSVRANGRDIVVGANEVS